MLKVFREADDESIWKQTYRCEERSELDREIKVDAVIIGGE